MKQTSEKVAVCETFPQNCPDLFRRHAHSLVPSLVLFLFPGLLIAPLFSGSVLIAWLISVLSSSCTVGTVFITYRCCPPPHHHHWVE